MSAAMASNSISQVVIGGKESGVSMFWGIFSILNNLSEGSLEASDQKDTS